MHRNAAQFDLLYLWFVDAAAGHFLSCVACTPCIVLLSKRLRYNTNWNKSKRSNAKNGFEAKFKRLFAVIYSYHLLFFPPPDSFNCILSQELWPLRPHRNLLLSNNMITIFFSSIHFLMFKIPLILWHVQKFQALTENHIIICFVTR